MSKLIVLVGISGVGKTALAHALQSRGGFDSFSEQHETRPFQALFKSDQKYALANQIDYLLLRAEQEQELRNGSRPGVMDGGLDLDYFGFTRLFHARGWLSDDEFDLCRRLHAWTRGLLPPPDMIVSLTASPHIIRERLAGRERINIASDEDSQRLQGLINDWLQTVPQQHVLYLETSGEKLEYTASVEAIVKRMHAL